MITIEFGAFRIDAKGAESKSDLELQVILCHSFFCSFIDKPFRSSVLKTQDSKKYKNKSWWPSKKFADKNQRSVEVRKQKKRGKQRGGKREKIYFLC